MGFAACVRGRGSRPQTQRNSMKSTLFALSGLFSIGVSALLFFGGCSKTSITIESIEQASESSGDSDSSATGATNLVAFHATLESLNMTRSMSPISANTLVTIYAFHGDIDNATSTAPMARGTYVAQQAGMLTGVSNYKMYLSNGIFDFYAVSTNSSVKFPTISNGISSGLQNGVDYLWWGCANYEIDGSQVTVPIVFNHAATQLVIELSAGEGLYLGGVVSATVTPPQTGSTLDLGSGTITPATGYGTTPAAMGVTDLTLQYTMLPLQSETPMTLTLSLSVNYDPTPRQYSVSIPVPDGGFQGGNSYLYQAIVDANTVTFPSVDVNDWNTVDESGNPLSPH